MTVAAILGFDVSWDATLRNVLVGSLILGLTSGVLGSFSVLRRQSLIGDTLAHAALPGICLAFMVSGTRTNEWLLTGGLATGLIGIFVMMAISRWSQVKPETALGIVLSVFFGFGILLLTRIQHANDAGQSGLDRFIFGQAATILPRDLVVMAAVAVVTLGIVFLLFKELKMLSFDPDFAAAQGMRPGVTSSILAALTVGVVMMGLQTVGVVLMVSLLIAPAVAARQWTRSLSSMIVLSGFFGILSGVLGAASSSLGDRLPTGPMIVTVASTIVLVSIFMAPDRGVFSRFRTGRDRARRMRNDLVQIDHQGRVIW